MNKESIRTHLLNIRAISTEPAVKGYVTNVLAMLDVRAQENQRQLEKMRVVK